MTKTIQGVVSKAQTLILAACPSILSAPEYATDARLDKTSIAYPTNIQYKTRSDFANILFDLKIEVKIGRKDLKDAMQFLMPLPEQICTAIAADPTIGGTCQTYGGSDKPITCNLVTENVNGMVTIGWEITVPDVKI